MIYILVLIPTGTEHWDRWYRLHSFLPTPSKLLKLIGLVRTHNYIIFLGCISYNCIYTFIIYYPLRTFIDEKMETCQKRSSIYIFQKEPNLTTNYHSSNH